MDFKLVSKNNMGVVATLILVILLSQSKFFNFLIDTALGRAILILFILVISFINKILGVVAVLFIIIMFNQSSIGYMEGFTGALATSNDSSQNKNKLNNQNTTTTMPSTASTMPSTTSTMPSTASTMPSTMPSTTMPSTTMPSTTMPSTTNSESFRGREGFNTIDRESTMLRGKRSNEIGVLSNVRKQGDNVEPTDMSVFSNTFSSV